MKGSLSLSHRIGQAIKGLWAGYGSHAQEGDYVVSACLYFCPQSTAGGQKYTPFVDLHEQTNSTINARSGWEAISTWMWTRLLVQDAS